MNNIQKEVNIHQKARRKFLALSLETTRKSYYPQLKTQLELVRNNEKRLQLLIDNLPAQISYINVREQYVFVNKQFEETFDVNREKVIGRSLKDVLGRRIYNELKTHIANAVSGQSGHFEFSFSTESNISKYYGIDYVSEKDISGNPSGFYVLAIDLTEKKREEEERQNLKDRLRQSQKMEAIGTLAGGIAHDFNNILFPIIGRSEMLLEDLPEGSFEHENAQEIYQAAKRAGDLVNQILTISRQSELKMVPVRLQNILVEVLKLSRSTIPSNIEIHDDIQQDCGLAMAEPTQMHQIAMNLITNAFHAVEEKNGTIDIELKEIALKDNAMPDSALKLRQYARLSVSDNGIGMTPNTIHNIFEPYFTTKERGKGTGLGLAIVYGIVKKHKGEIKVYSELGKGTTFNVYLPLLEKKPAIATANNVARAATGTESILLVDDEVSIAKLEDQILSRLGYQVTIETSSEEALNTFRSNPDYFDLVISDMTMPNMTGDQLAKEILSIKPNKPIIICTGFSERINKKQAEMLGIKGYLMKPVAKSDMAQMVRNVLDDSKNS